MTTPAAFAPALAVWPAISSSEAAATFAIAAISSRRPISPALINPVPSAFQRPVCAATRFALPGIGRSKPSILLAARSLAQLRLEHVFRQHMRDGLRRTRDLRTNFAAAGADQALIGRDQRGVRTDPDPAVAGEHLHVEMQVHRGAGGMVEIIRDHADLLALRYDAAIEQAIGVQRLRVHMHVAETDVLGPAVDLQRHGLVLGSAYDPRIAHGDDGALLGITGLAAFTRRWALSRADVLALMAITAAALPDLETAGFAEIVAPGIGGRALHLVALGIGLRVYERGRLLERKADLCVGHHVGMAALLAVAGVRDDVAARPVGEIRGTRRGTIENVGSDVRERPHALAARHAQRLQEALGDRIGLLAGKPPRLGNAVEALDRHHIGDAETGESVAHIAFPDELAQVRVERRERFDRLALAARGIGNVIDERRTRNLHLDRP